MPFTGILPPLLFSLSFLVIAVWLFRRGRRAVCIAPAFTALVLTGFTLVVYVQDRNHAQARHDLAILLDELDREELYSGGDLRDAEETLFLLSTASMALYRAREYAPERTLSIDSALLRMADWARRANHLPQWRGGYDWDHEVFFLAHAGAILGHYQLATTDESFAVYFQRIGRHLGGRMRQGHYKHLGSRAGEDLLRPADNAAAVYTLTLYDQYYGETVGSTTRAEWTNYIQDELHYAESRLPCAAFTETNRCSIEPSAAATGLYIAYRAAAAGPSEVVDDIPYREWLHYFRRFSGNPFGLSIRANMRKGQVARLCDAGLTPLDCGRYEDAIGLWVAAEYGGGYTYFRLACGNTFARWFGGTPAYAAMRPARRVRALTEITLRMIAEGRRRD